ncbi:hypothetical protein AB0C14_22065 [Microbispora hainanensis]|uniref:hypothetical protein n=1 Tax=Microbispora hainanensis TaxID=568844 RepID=UPI0033CA3137
MADAFHSAFFSGLPTRAVPAAAGLLVVAATTPSLTGARLRIPPPAAVARCTRGSAFAEQARRLHQLITTERETP